MVTLSTVFGKQFSNCKIKPGVSLEPTMEEIELACIERPGMRGGMEIKQILNPGPYVFTDLETDLKPGDPQQEDVQEYRKKYTQKPKLTHIEDAVWSRKETKDWTVTIKGYTDTIPVPVEDATDEKLGYYGCRILQKNDRLNLTERCVVVDFIYDADYMEKYVNGVEGGPGIEHHSFAHIDTPLEDNSGFMVLGKVNPDEGSLELTAFSIPKGVSVYVPKDTVHSNDYFLGRWETLIAPACSFPSAKLKTVDRSALKLDIRAILV